MPIKPMMMIFFEELQSHKSYFHVFTATTTQLLHINHLRASDGDGGGALIALITRNMQ